MEAKVDAADQPVSYRAEFQKGHREAGEAFEILRECWPAAFPEDHRQIKPLVTDAVGQLAIATGWSLAYVRGVLLDWKGRPAYCRAVLAHPVRYDLDGSPTDQMIDDHARDLARAKLAEWTRKRGMLPPRKAHAPETGETAPSPGTGGNPPLIRDNAALRQRLFGGTRRPTVRAAAGVRAI